jgi:hypothetical protein
MLLFTAFNVCQNLSGQIMKDNGFENLGFYSLATLYFCFSLCSFFATAIVNKIGNIKVSLSLGAFCYSFWVLCFILPSFYHQWIDDPEKLKRWYMNKGLITFLTFFTAAINGAGAGILWTSQGKYISECACEQNQGFYMGYFWAFFMSSQIIGNVIAWATLGSNV